jgi:hypothetical protein
MQFPFFNPQVFTQRIIYFTYTLTLAIITLIFGKQLLNIME